MAAAYYFKRNEALNANDFFRNRDGLPRTFYRYDYPGYYIGGPVLIPGLLKIARKAVLLLVAGVSAAHHADSARPADVPDRARAPGRLFANRRYQRRRDPDSRSAEQRAGVPPFPGNIIPANRIDKAGQGLLNVFPMPNTVDPGHTFNTVFQGRLSQPHHFEVLRLDWNISSKTTFYTRLHHNGDKTSSKRLVQRVSRKQSVPAVHRKLRIPLARRGWNTDPHLQPDSDQRTYFRREPLPAEGLSTRSVIPGQSQPGEAGDRLPAVLPAIQSAERDSEHEFRRSAERAGQPLWEQRWIFYGTNTPYTLSDNLSKFAGKHNLKAGFFFERTSRNAVACCPGSSFMGTADFGRNTLNPLDTNYAYSNAMLGVMSSYLESDIRLPLRARYYNFEWFMQDNWRVTKRLTLDLGVRFYHIDSTTSAHSKLASFEPGLYDPAKSAKLIQPYIAPGTTARVGLNPATGEIVPAVLIGTLAPNSGHVLPGNADL